MCFNFITLEDCFLTLMGNVQVVYIFSFFLLIICFFKFQADPDSFAVCHLFKLLVFTGVFFHIYFTFCIQLFTLMYKLVTEY